MARRWLGRYVPCVELIEGAIQTYNITTFLLVVCRSATILFLGGYIRRINRSRFNHKWLFGSLLAANADVYIAVYSVS